MALMDRLLVGLALSAVLAVRGLRKGSLDPGGAAAAFAVGVVHMATGYRNGIVLIMFYLTGSALTRIKHERKAQLQADYKPGGQRDASQVLAKGAVGVIAALAGAAAATRGDAVLANAAAAAFLGHYACCAADTWGSEIGILSTSAPRLVTNLRAVPPGTNGAMSPLGTAAGAAGAALMGVAYALSAALAPGEAAWLHLPLATTDAPVPGTRGAVVEAVAALRLAVLAAAAGVAGSLIDSLLGATLQYSGVDRASGKAVQAAGKSVDHVAGRDVLRNSGVNALASSLTALGSAALAAAAAAGVAAR